MRTIEAEIDKARKEDLIRYSYELKYCRTYHDYHFFLSGIKTLLNQLDITVPEQLIKKLEKRSLRACEKLIYYVIDK